MWDDARALLLRLKRTWALLQKFPEYYQQYVLAEWANMSGDDGHAKVGPVGPACTAGAAGAVGPFAAASDPSGVSGPGAALAKCK